MRVMLVLYVLYMNWYNYVCMHACTLCVHIQMYVLVSVSVCICTCVFMRAYVIYIRPLFC